MRNTELNSTRKGFTLVEVIVVLVILAILAAIAIPAMTGWIDRAREKRLIVGCRTSVTAAQALVVETYGETSKASPPEYGAVKALSGVTGDVTGIQLMKDSPQIQHLTYTEDGDSVTYCADAECGDYYNFNMGIINDGTDYAKTLIGTVVNVNNAATDNNKLTTADSNSPIDGEKYGLAGWTGKTLTALAQTLGLADTTDASAAADALRGANIQTWALRDNGKTILLSDQSISNAKVNDMVRTLCYVNGTYKVGYAPVVTNTVKKDGNSCTYNILGKNARDFEQSGTTYSTYEAALKALSSLPLSKTP